MVHVLAEKIVLESVGSADVRALHYDTYDKSDAAVRCVHDQRGTSMTFS
jgi:hypothetical protein